MPRPNHQRRMEEMYELAWKIKPTLKLVYQIGAGASLTWWMYYQQKQRLSQKILTQHY